MIETRVVDSSESPVVLGSSVVASEVSLSAIESPAEALEGMFRRSVAFCRTHPLLPALLGDPPVDAARDRSPASDERIEPHRDLVASLLERGIASGDFRRDLDVPATADVICELQGRYSGRAYRGDPHFPDDPRVIEAAIALIRAAVTA